MKISVKKKKIYELTDTSSIFFYINSFEIRTIKRIICFLLLGAVSLNFVCKYKRINFDQLEKSLCASFFECVYLLDLSNSCLSSLN